MIPIECKLSASEELPNRNNDAIDSLDIHTIEFENLDAGHSM